MGSRGMKRRWTVLLLALVMVVAAGCQSLGGVDLNQVALSSGDYRSFEGKAVMGLEVTVDDLTAAFIGVDPETLELIRNIRLEFYDLKQESPIKASVAGILHIAGEEIPFAYSVNANQLALEVDGIKRPIVLDDASSNPLLALMLEETSMTYEEYQMSFMEAVKKMASWVIPNLPNPGDIRFSREPIVINGEQVFTTHIRTVIRGDELIPYLRNALTRLAEDEEGLRRALEQVYDLMLPIMERALGAIGEQMQGEGGASFFRLLESYVYNKTLMVEFLATTITYGLKEAAMSLDSTEEQALGLEEELGVSILNDQTWLAYDLYVEDFTKLRRMDFEMVVRPEAAFPIPVNAGIRVYMSQEYWNVNDRPVEADMIDTTDAIVLDDSFQTDALLAEIDPASALGRLLIAQGLNKREFTVFVGDPEAAPEDGAGLFGSASPFLQDGRTMVSAYWLANRLGLEWDLDWDEEDNEIITYIDPVTGRTLTVTEGSATAVLDGGEIEMGTAAVMRGYTLYVPLRFVAETFGAEVIFDAETRTVTVTKRLF